MGVGGEDQVSRDSGTGHPQRAQGIHRHAEGREFRQAGGEAGLRVSPFGVVAALLHLALLAHTLWLILSTSAPKWSGYWIIFLALDFPLSLGVMPVTWLVPPSPAGPLSDFSNFWWPAVYHGVVGTAWWYVVGTVIARKVSRGGTQDANKG